MINEYKKRKFRAFNERFDTEKGSWLRKDIDGAHKTLFNEYNKSIQQFITDIISEMAECLPKEKDINKVHNHKWKDTGEAKNYAGGEVIGHNNCRQEFFNNLNKK